MGYARELADRYGVAADIALHAPRTITDRELKKNPDQYHETDPETGRRHNGNWHAHIMLSACHVQPDGTLGKKAVELDPIHCQRAKIANMTDRERSRWSELANAALERNGHTARVDHRSHAERGIDREPTKHLGVAAVGYERRTGEKSRKRLDFETHASEKLAAAKQAGELDRKIQDVDKFIIDLSANLSAAKRERDIKKSVDGMASFLGRFESKKLAEEQARSDAAHRALLSIEQQLEMDRQRAAEQERQRQQEHARRQAIERQKDSPKKDRGHGHGNDSGGGFEL